MYIHEYVGVKRGKTANKKQHYKGITNLANKIVSVTLLVSQGPTSCMRKRQKGRDRERGRERKRVKEREREREREREKEREREREREREGGRKDQNFLSDVILKTSQFLKNTLYYTHAFFC